MGGLSAIFVMLILLLLLADLLFTSPQDFREALAKPEIQAAFRLTILSCTLAAIMSLWVATPMGYLLSRYRFPGRWMIDTLVDIPIVLPPLVLGLSLLILVPSADRRLAAGGVAARQGTAFPSPTTGQPWCWRSSRWHAPLRFAPCG
jgi:ABC-type sulfate transport system permease component